MAVTPNYGWPVPVATDYVKDGWEAISDLGNAIDTTVAGLGSGLTLIKTQTVGTTVSSVTVSDAFSTDYNAYRIIYTGGTASTNTTLRLQLGATTTGYYSSYIYNVYSNNSPQAAGNSNGAYFNYSGYGSTTVTNFDIELLNPFETALTFVKGFVTTPNTASDSGNMSGFLNNSTSYTAFTILSSSGTLTGGTIRVYGYQKA